MSLLYALYKLSLHLFSKTKGENGLTLAGFYLTCFDLPRNQGKKPATA